ncbi:two pore domain potassium channel family protein [Flavobacterium rakeshii]|uniref:Two pore domain potassium channel family protein n=1 Tax=Flavobacterium rakeshii TaxID=1038845 RepID=A0A6N8H7A7_9FLAO|nr:potassium channel family protein [Flavobacterium rakeshii]MUV02484.1 two pore domain potassium channel family protein [Flavobacterium rakeshii]
MLFFNTITSFLKNREYRDLLYTTTIILIVGTISYHFIEGWSLVNSLYFSVITLTTIGYGDFAPQTDLGKMFTIVYILMGLGIILQFINTVKNHYSETRNKHHHKKDR